MSGKLTYIEIPTSITSDNLILMQQRDKILITLSGAGIDNKKGTINFDYGASEFVKEDINQNLVLFGVAGVNGAYVQVTGTNAKTITWSGMFYSKYATQEKERLEQVLCSGLPLSFTAIYNSTPYRVVIQSASFEIRKSCYITYNITLVEYNPIIFSIIKSDYWYGIPENLVTNPGGASEIAKNNCKKSITYHCDGVKDWEERFSADYTSGTINMFGNINQLGETGSIDLAQLNQDIISCVEGTMHVNPERTKKFLQGILNGLYQIFLLETFYGGYYISNGKKIYIDIQECMDFTQNREEAFINFLLYGCYRMYHSTGSPFSKELILPRFDPYGADGHICFAQSFVEEIEDSIKPLIGSTYMVIVDTPVETEKSFVELSPLCAIECLKGVDTDDPPTGSGGSSSGGDTSNSRSADFSVSLNVDSETSAQVVVSKRDGVTGRYSVSVWYPVSDGVDTHVVVDIDDDNPKAFIQIDMTGLTPRTSYNVDIIIYEFKGTGTETSWNQIAKYKKVLIREEASGPV
jgi:hypothetical protein